eukprot:TRINITY_DN11305_c0_g1_i6.p1 TRINITY_DN11305_c0_g1~~TRINITY_DN11305_c0_g1_i6.p1  ORF type:complete len:321 (+),score=61.84 TRINITY_DN11305_c0_g1_i6:45-1007(+)
MGALLTRHRFRYLQRAFQQTDFQGKGFLTPEESFELAERFAIQTLRPSDIEDNMDLYGFINFLESHAKQVFVYTDSDEDGLISVSETVSTYAALGILGVDEIKVLMNLRRTQYLYPELINPDDVVATNLPVSFDVWMIGLVEFFFTASVREAVSAASPRKLFEGYGYHDPALRYKTYGVGFRSKIQRFQELTPTLGPGEYDVPTASITIRDPSRPSSSFVTTPRKETKHQVHLGPGEYEPNPFSFTTKKHTLCFQSSAPRIMTNLPGDQEYRTKTEPLIGPGSYESAESRSHLLHKDAACIFPKYGIRHIHHAHSFAFHN